MQQDPSGLTLPDLLNQLWPAMLAPQGWILDGRLLRHEQGLHLSVDFASFQQGQDCTQITVLAGYLNPVFVLQERGLILNSVRRLQSVVSFLIPNPCSPGLVLKTWQRACWSLTQHGQAFQRAMMVQMQRFLIQSHRYRPGGAFEVHTIGRDVALVAPPSTHVTLPHPLAHDWADSLPHLVPVVGQSSLFSHRSSPPFSLPNSAHERLRLVQAPPNLDLPAWLRA